MKKRLLGSRISIGRAELGLLARTASLCCLLVCGCNLVAGLGDFQPPTGATGSTGDSTGSAGGGGGAGAASTSSAVVTSTGSKGTSVTTGSGGTCASHLVINEVRIQNGDFVELFNPTKTAILLDGMTLHARTSTSMLGLKWTAKGGATVNPGAFYLLTTDASGDDMLTSGIVSDDPTVVVLEGSGGATIDAVCVCTATGCAFADGANEYCAGIALVAPSYHVTNDTSSAQRHSCADTDVDSVDFGVACPTPGTANFTAGACP